MKRTFLSLGFRLMVLAMCACAVVGQPLPDRDKMSGRMFSGETLVFEGKINKILHGITIAELTFSAMAEPGTDKLVITSEAVSKGTLLKLFRYSFLQHYESTVDLNSFRILKTTKHDVQRERVRDSVADFDYGDRRVTFVENDPKDPMKPPRRIASTITDNVQDVISAIYSVRTLPLAVGSKMSLSVSDSGLVYTVPFTVTGREQQKTKIGKLWCLKVEPDIFGTGKLIEQEGKMIIWMTDDSKHIPVRAQIDSQYGKIEIKLKSASGTK